TGDAPFRRERGWCYAQRRSQPPNRASLTRHHPSTPGFMSSLRFSRARHALTVLLLAAAVAGCGDSTGPKGGTRITPELVRLSAGSGGPSAAMVAAAASWALEGVDGDAKFATTDLQIESLKMPITEIYLFNTVTPQSHHAPVYTCTDGDCLI